MHPQPQRVLRKLLEDYGLALLEDPARVDALLADFCGEYARERFLLAHALRVRVSVGPAMFWLGACSQRLQSRYCFSAEAAQWAVESWSAALDIAPPDPNAFQDGAELSESPRHTLSQLLTACGPDLLNEPARINALLADLCGEYPSERFLLVHTLRECIPSSLLGQDGPGHERLLSQRLQKRYGFSAQAVRWTIASWSWALQSARSAHDQRLAEAVEAQATAEATVRLKAEERAAADVTAHRKAEERAAADAVARQKAKERAASYATARLKGEECIAADAVARHKAEERAAADATARQLAEEWTAKKAAARLIHEEVEEIMLQVMDSNPMTSREVAEVLGKEQEQTITWLRRLQEAGRVEYVWLKRSPHHPCYQSRKHPNVPATAEDTSKVDGIEPKTVAHARAKAQVAAEAAVLEKAREQAAAETTARLKAKEQAVAKTAAHQKATELAATEAIARLKLGEQGAAEMTAGLKAKEQAAAQMIVRYKTKEQATVKESAQRKAKERNAAEAVALQKKEEWLAAEATARRKVEDWLAAEAAAQQKAKEQAEAAAAARQKEKELPENILQKLEQGPLTSRELAKILQAEQEHVIALLKRFLKEGKIALIWLPHSPHSPCYQIRECPKTLAPDQDSFPARHRGWRWLAILAATLLLTGIGTAPGGMEGVISQWQAQAPVAWRNLTYWIDNLVEEISPPQENILLIDDPETRETEDVGPVSSPTLTQTATPEQPTSTPTITPIPESPLATINRVMNVRRGPGTHHAIIDVADIGEEFPIIGKNVPGDWWQIDYRGEKAWVYATYVAAPNTENVKIAPTPTPLLSPTPTPTPTRRGDNPGGRGQRAVIVHVVDGDTVDVRFEAGGADRIRLFDINTPETYIGVECYGRQATAFTNSFNGQEIEVESRGRDRYDRLLGYIWLADGRMLNEELAQGNCI